MATIHDLSREELLNELLEFERQVAIAIRGLNIQKFDFPSQCEYTDDEEIEVSPPPLVAQEIIPTLPPESAQEEIIPSLPLELLAVSPVVDEIGLELNSFLAPRPPTPVVVIDFTSDQSTALDGVADWLEGNDPYFALTGPAGSGKTTCVREIIRRHGLNGDDGDGGWCDDERRRFGYALSAMTGKAALRLAQCSGEGASTLHKILYWPPKPGEEVRFARLRNPESRLVLVDESSMISPTVKNHLDVWAKQGIRMLLVGDSYQLPPVITGEEARENGEDYSVFSHVKGAALETVMRSAGGVLRAATEIRRTGRLVRESDIDSSGGYEFIADKHSGSRAVDNYLADPDDHLLITWKNQSRMGANRAIRARLGREGELPDEGEPVLIKANGQGYLNGEIVTCAGFDSGPIVGSIQTMWMRTTGGARILVTVNGGREGEFFDGGRPWVESYKSYHIDLNKQSLDEPIPVTWGYCVTCHAAQGSEARRVTVFLAKGDETNMHFNKPTTLPSGEVVPYSARWLYTAATRSKNMTTMIVPR